MDIIDVLFARALSGGGGGTPTLIEKTITENGTYNAADDNADGYSKVVVDVSGGGKPALVPWSTGTDDEIVAMVNGYYDGKLTIDEIKSVWSLGDSRSVNLSAMEATGVGESHRAQTVELQILDFEHDDLTTAIGEKTKALVTLNQKDCLMDVECAAGTKHGENNTENGYMNVSNTNVGGWTDCRRRNWCNSIFFQALPQYLQQISKAVNKLTSAGNRSSNINTDSDFCFLLSEIETVGVATYSQNGEGYQYAFFSMSIDGRYKLPKYDNNSVSNVWWFRSPRGANTTEFCVITANGSAVSLLSSLQFGISPCICL